MSQAASPVPDNFISQTPDVCGGVPVIAGTRIRVSHVANRYERKRQSPEKIVQAYPHLTQAQVHTALAYYYLHREAIDEEIVSSEELLTQAHRTFPSKP